MKTVEIAAEIRKELVRLLGGELAAKCVVEAGRGGYVYISIPQPTIDKRLIIDPASRPYRKSDALKLLEILRGMERVDELQ